MSASGPSSMRNLKILVIPLALISGVMVWLFVAQAYTIGYASAKASVFHTAYGLWELEDWQHCFLVPFAVGTIVFLDRKRLAALPVAGSWLGLPLLLLGMALYWFGFMADIVYFGYASAQIVLAALIVLFLGWEWMRALFFPWLFLAFMWPLLFLDNLLAFPLRIVMSKASVVVLNGIGIPCTLSGTAILSASDALTGKQVGQLFAVDVADPCSGIRSLFALMMVSALYGYFALRGWWRRCILFAASIPLAVIGNLFRILMLTLGTIAMGPDWAIGSLEKPSFFHMLSGYVVFAVGLGGMLAISTLLNSLRGGLNKMRSPTAPQLDKPAVPREDAR